MAAAFIRNTVAGAVLAVTIAAGLAACGHRDSAKNAAGETLVADRLDGAAARQDYAGYIVQESRRLNRLVDNLLAFTRVTDTPEVRPPLEAVVLADVVAESLDRFAVQLAAGAFRVEVAVAPTLPPVQGDRTGLALMLDNLVDNAIRHSRGAHHIMIRARAEGRAVVLEVSDRGGGIPSDEVRHVTRKFYRGRHAGHGGTGLGLAIASRIVEDHRGRLFADHDRRRVGVATGDLRHDRGVSDAQPFDAVHAQPRIDHRVAARSHPAGADRV